MQPDARAFQGGSLKFMFWQKKITMVTPGAALPGRMEAMVVPTGHFIKKNPLKPPFPPHMQVAYFGLGCFWGAERQFWEQEGVFSTAVGYAAGLTSNPTYEEVCSGLTGHNEVVQVVFDPKGVSYDALLAIFWESHDPTQGMRQGNDVGTQYRSGIYTVSPDQKKTAWASREHYQQALTARGFGPITTEIVDMPVFYFAEAYHQQYLAKNPGGYCGLAGTRVNYGITSSAMPSAVPSMARLLAGRPLDDVIIDPANPNLIMHRDG